MSSLIVEAVRIKDIIPIEKADNIVIAQVKGWNVIIQKNQYQINDLVVFIPPDSIIPQNLIEKHQLTYMKNGDRIRSVKLRGVISQGLVLPLPSGKWKEGDDLSTVMGITKWQPPEPIYNIARSGNQISKKKLNPYFDKYTEIENIKNYQDVFDAGDYVVVTEKEHGSNWRAGNLPISVNENATILERFSAWFRKNILKQTHEFVWGSHNVQKGVSVNHQNFYGEDVWGAIAKRYNMAEIIPEDYIFYGEVIGKGIQDLEYGLDHHELYIFDIKYKGNYLSWHEVQNICYTLNLKVVPELYVGQYYDGILDDYTAGKSIICPSQIREGVVIKSFTEENDPKIGRKILKSISPDYLLRKGNTTEFK
jgi:RNA ligase (TIGR02306 family)